MQEHWKPLNLLVQWQHATAWQIKLHEKSGCFLLHSSVSLFCDVRDKNVKWLFHFRDLHEFFKISFFLPTKCWSPTNSSEENLLDEIALIEFQCTGSRSRRQPGNTSKYSDGFFICKTKNSTRANTLNFQWISCYIVLAVTSGLRGGYEHWHRRRRIFLSRSVLTHGPYSLCTEVPSSLRKNSGEDFHSWGRRRRLYTRQARSL